MVIRHNLHAINSNRMLGITTRKNTSIVEKLSSGYRINRSADDAAGLSISEKMRRQIRGLTQASANAQDGISLVQSAEGALNEVHDMLQRANELAVKACNGTLSAEDRGMLEEEYQQLKEAIDGVAKNTTFNEIRLFPQIGNSPNIGIGATNYSYNITYNVLDRSVALTNAVENIGEAGNARAISSGNTLADKIANEYVPNAIKQIFAAFPSLMSMTGVDIIEMGLELEVIDGPGGTLAYAQASFTNQVGSKPVDMLIRVDTNDFTEVDALGTGVNAEVLESTLAHELMHSVMQYNLSDGMIGRNGEDYPTWFVEGTAQLAGGGYTTGWNDQLMYYAKQLSSETDTSQDANITNFLKNYTIENRPYGHGYLASAYIGWLANSGGSITGANIAAGMDKIFLALNSGTTLSDAIKNLTGKEFSTIDQMFKSGDTQVVEFVRRLTYASFGGAGSVVARSLNTGGTNIIETGANEQAFRIAKTTIGTGNLATATSVNSIELQVGAEANQKIQVSLFRMDTHAIGMETSTVATQNTAGLAIDEVKGAIHAVSRVRSYYGAIQNRLEHTINNLDNVVENTTASESAIRDTDMAKAMVEYSINNILQQAGQAMLTQANKNPEYILGLF